MMCVSTLACDKLGTKSNASWPCLNLKQEDNHLSCPFTGDLFQILELSVSITGEDDGKIISGK